MTPPVSGGLEPPPVLPTDGGERNEALAPPLAPGTLRPHREQPLVAMARNVSARYLLIVLNLAMGLLIVPFNLRHLGQDAYGLWILAASITTYFTALDLGYGTAVLKFVSEHRARRDIRGLNEVLSTMAIVFTGLGVLCYALAIVVAILLPHLFNVAPDQVWTGRAVLLLIALQVAVTFPFAIYGSVTNAFERYDINDVTAVVFNVLAVVVNVIVLYLGYGLLELVAATTVARILPLWVYRRNAYRVYPQLEISRALFRRDRLRELTGFSVYAAVTGWSVRLTYATAPLYLGIFVNTAAVFIYSVANRIAESLQMLTEQLHTFMMPAIVHRAVDGAVERQRGLMVRATRLELATAMCLCGVVAALAQTLLHAWLGPSAAGAIIVTQMLAVLVVARTSIAMPSLVLQGTGHHRYLAAVMAAAAAINLVLSIPLARLWGAVGVAASTLVAVAMMVLLVFPRSCRVVQLGVWAGVQKIVLPTLWPAAVAMLAVVVLDRWLPQHLILVLANLGVGAVIYAAVFVLFGVDREEREWLISAFQRLLPGSRGAGAPG